MANKPIEAGVLREFVNAVRDASTGRIKATEYLSGVVTHTDVDGTVWVDVAGGVNDMPVTRATASYSPGDVVSFSIENGVASIGGNVTDPGAPISKQITVEKRVVKTEETVEKIGNIVADKADILELHAAEGRIGDLEADHVSTTDLQAETARVDNLLAGKASVADLNAATGRIGTLETNTADIGTIRANSAKVNDVTAQQITAATGYISDLTAGNVSAANIISDHAAVGSLDANYAQIDMANVNNAWITNGTIKNGAISSAMINDVSANKLTAGTINGSVINVTNLNADNITTGTINGQRIGEGSLSLDKLSEDVYTEAEVDARLSTMQQQIDGAIETWTGTAVPTLQNAPASSWTTTQLKDQHVGDVYFVVNSQSQQNGYNYRFTKSGNEYSWQLIKDSDVTAALQRLTTAEGKITTFESDISTLQTDTGTLTTRTTNLETRADGVDSALLDKVDTTDFSELEDTVDGHTRTLSQHTTAISNKADSSTVTSLTTRVNKNETDISGINTTIGTLQTTVASKADGSTVSTLRSEYNETKTTVAGHETRLTATESVANGVRTDLDNLEIGGRNLLVKSDWHTPENYAYSRLVRSGPIEDSTARSGCIFRFTVSDATSNTKYVYLKSMHSRGGMVDGEEYVASFWIRASKETTTHPNAHVECYKSPQTRLENPVITTTWQRCSNKFIYNVSASYQAWYLLYPVAIEGFTTDDYIEICGLKLERGNKPTDWTPAPEDLETEVTTLKTDYATYKQTTTENLSTLGTTVQGIDGRVSTAESTITQHATDIEAKVSKNGIIAAINLSTEESGGSAVKIKADKVNIEGAAIFTSGRLSQTSLDGAYDANGAASAAQAAAISAAATDATSKANAAQTAATNAANQATDQKLASYSTTQQMNQAITTGTANLAPKADAIARTQRIWYRQTDSGAAPSANTTWLSTSGTGYGNWSLSVPQLTDGSTKYPKLYTAVQTQTVAQQAAGSTCSCSPVLLDDSTTVIDGGNIITGSVAANKIVGHSISADQLTVGVNDSIDDAAKTATNYITEVSGGGIKVHDANDSSDYVQITSAGMDVYNDGDNVASFGSDGARIGKAYVQGANDNESHMELDYHSLQLVDKEGNTYLHVSDLRGTDGKAEIVDEFIGDGTTTTFNLSLVAEGTNYTVSVSDSSGGTVTPTNTAISFQSAPTSGATITVAYSSASTLAKAYTLGLRKSSGNVGAYSFVEGHDNIASGSNSHAEGHRTTASGSHSHAEGAFTTASNFYSHAEGGSTTASGSYSHAEGGSTTASGSYSHAEGDHTTASSYYSHAEGFRTTASGNSSHAEGYYTEANSVYSHAEGFRTTASGNSSHAEGYRTTASGNTSHVEGYDTEASGDYSHAEGYGTNADGNRSHAEGSGTTATGNYSHAEGTDTEASGQNSHAEGHQTVSGGQHAHAEGNYTIANGNGSHAEGYWTISEGDYAHAGGYRTKALYENQTVVGKFNDANEKTVTLLGDGLTTSFTLPEEPDIITKVTVNYGSITSYTFNGTLITFNPAPMNGAEVQVTYSTDDGYAFVIGNGTADDARSNALAVQWDGTVETATPIPIASGGTGATSASAAWTALGGGSIGKKDSLAAADIPNLAASKITSGTLAVARGGTGITDFGHVENESGSNVSVATSAWKQIASFSVAAGDWLVIVGCYSASNSTGRRGWYLGTESSASDVSLNRLNSIVMSATSGTCYATIVNRVSVSSTTTYRVWGWQNSGSALNMSAYIRRIKIG